MKKTEKAVLWGKIVPMTKGYNCSRKLLPALLVLLAFTHNLHAQNINTITGIGLAGYNGEGSPAITKQVNNPFGLAVDATGNVYVADKDNHRIRMITPGGVISTVAGNGTTPYVGDGIPATSASVKNPYGVAVDASGNLFIADTYNDRIRMVDATGTIFVVAGNGLPGYFGDGANATDAELFRPTGIAVDAAGNLYIADCQNQVIRKVDASSGTISTIAGNNILGYTGDAGPATDASLRNPMGVAVDASGNVFIADSGNNVIRKVDATGIITTYASVAAPTSVCLDNTGNVFANSMANNSAVVINTSGSVTTIAGGLGAGFSGDGGPATSAKMNTPSSITVSSAGDIYISDMGNSRVREIAVPIAGISPITGNTLICIGTPSTLSDATPGGAWSSDDPTIATVDATLGVVTGISVGTTIISYSTGTASASVVVTVSSDAPPSAGKIMGANQLCPGNTCILTSSVSSGVWTSSNTSVCTVSSYGIVKGLVPGSSTISYTVTNSCGAKGTVKYGFTVLPYYACPGSNTAVTTPAANSNVMTAWPNPNNGTFMVKLNSTMDEQANIIVTNLVGEKVAELNVPTNKERELSLHVAPGVYFINATTAHNSTTQKILVRPE